MINLESLISGFKWCYFSCGIFSRIDANNKLKIKFYIHYKKIVENLF